MIGTTLEALIREASSLNNYLTDMQSANDRLKKQVQTLNVAMNRAEVAASRTIELLGDANSDLTFELHVMKQQNAQLLEEKAAEIRERSLRT